MREQAARFTPGDCLPDTAPRGQVVVAGNGWEDPAPLLFYCPATGAELTIGLEAVSLETGDLGILPPDKILGVLRPEALPDMERLQLSQIRPGAAQPPQQAPVCSAYCFLPDGRYTNAVHFESIPQAMAFVEMQKGFQHKIMLCDMGDDCIFEMVEGEVTFPTEDMLREQKTGQSGGMEMMT